MPLLGLTGADASTKNIGVHRRLSAFTSPSIRRLIMSTRAHAIHRAQELLTLNPVYLDTETTGLKNDAQIVEICVLDSDGSVLVDSLVRPTIRISPEARQVHGLTDAMVKTAPTWAELWPTVEQALTGRVMAIYNAEFDQRLMAQSHAAHRLRWTWPANAFTCIMLLYAQYRGEWNAKYGNYRWHSLEVAQIQCGLSLPNAHRAQADALLARAVLRHMAGE
jgi:DNA polymerase III epsilon subunit-like protein